MSDPTTPEDICNRALSEMGARVLITNLDEDTPQGKQCNIFYNVVRRLLLRAAPWGFARKTVALTKIGLSTDDPPAAPFPWYAKYTYPGDCLAMRYLLPVPLLPSGEAPDVSNGFFVPWCAPSREWRFLPAYDDTGVSPVRVILSNLYPALGVYTADVTDVTIMDTGFKDAFVAELANRLILPLSGNVKMKDGFVNYAKARVMEARAMDGNEAKPTTSHTPDWIAVRGEGYNNGVFNTPWANQGFWYVGYDNSWGM